MTETIFLRKILLWLQKVNLILSKISMRLFHTVERWITLVLQTGCLKAVKMSLKLQLVRTRPGFIISTQTNLVCQWSVQKMNFHPLLIILQLEQLRNSLVPGGWWLVAGGWLRCCRPCASGASGAWPQPGHRNHPSHILGNGGGQHWRLWDRHCTCPVIAPSITCCVLTAHYTWQSGQHCS